MTDAHGRGDCDGDVLWVKDKNFENFFVSSPFSITSGLSFSKFSAQANATTLLSSDSGLTLPGETDDSRSDDCEWPMSRMERAKFRNICRSWSSISPQLRGVDEVEEVQLEIEVILVHRKPKMKIIR
jgi:hypothetical protein